MLLPGLQARAVYTTGGQELDLGAGYGYHFASVPLALQADASFITPEGLAGRGYGVFASVAAEAGPFVNLFYLAVEAGYDSYLNHLGTGIGARIELTPEIALLGEVYPFYLLGKEQHPEELGSTSAWSTGAMLSIAGHQFSLLVGNSPALGERRLMAGAPPFGGIYLGFNIQRLLPL
jgi:hypothetical protein